MAGRLLIGTAPDSWGVWFPDDPQQTPWQRFLDEVVCAGYTRIELGPYGYLPTDASALAAELGARKLTVTAGTVAPMVRTADAFDASWPAVAQAATLTAAMGAEHLVVLPEARDFGQGRGAASPTDAEWSVYTGQVERLGAAVRDEFGLRLQIHPHADTIVDTGHSVLRLLADTDPELVNLCLDTGHLTYCGGDNLELIRRHPDRIGYLHLKQVDPVVLQQVRATELRFGEAVRLGAMCEPPGGIPAMPPILRAAEALAERAQRDLIAVVEQDMYPCAVDVPLPIATRTLDYLRSCAAFS
ncbi:MAG: sugar phosphate isomerase/epimerase [Actinomycetota bacterium]|nr:sugar phosphate isomerase/epimerase [Actinomycetota bacterium]